ncbi:CPBP family intramembrane metalloprotease [bacterium]|nr:CPBP family intramembrane metalloprotease [bacterium]
MPYLPESGSSIMMNSLSATVPVMLTIVFYSLYWLVKSSGKAKEIIYSRYEPDTANVVHVVFKRCAGFLLLGIVPVALTFLLTEGYTLADAGLGYRPDMRGFTLLGVILMSVLIIPVVSFSARKPSVYEIYPEIRVTGWTGRFLFAELFTWALYLLGYETLFRGVLLFGLAQSTGPVAATIISVILYSAAHLPKNMTETLAAIPFGLVLCLLSLYSGSIWIAFIVHLVNAVTTTITAIKFNPAMNFSISREQTSEV